MVNMSSNENAIFLWLTTLAVLSQHQTSLASHCHCMRMRDCQSYEGGKLNYAYSAVFKLNHDNRIPCGFDGNIALFCCPPAAAAAKAAAAAHNQQRRSASRVDDDRQIWVWDRRPLVQPITPITEVSSRATGKIGIFNDQNRQDRAVEYLNFFNYKDEKTSRNCPPVFYEDEEEYTSNFPYFPHHHANPGTLNSFSDSSEEISSDFVFPDDIRLRKRIHYPEEPRKPAATPFATSARPYLLGTTTMTTPMTTKTLPVINPSQCGLPTATINKTEQFPWIARIGYLNKTSNRISYRCSGSLVNELYVLTAAHCVIALVGDLELSHVRLGDANGQMAVTFQIDDVITHPSYDLPKYSNDIALLRIIRKTGSELGNVTSICLPLNESASMMEALINRTGIVAVWSANRDGVETANATVKYLRLPIVNTTQCAITYARFSEDSQRPIVIAPKQLCAQGQPQNDVCRGDSGGPFMDDGTSGIYNTDGRYTLLGIVAFGPLPCGISNFPGVYTRVSSYIAWIQYKMGLL